MYTSSFFVLFFVFCFLFGWTSLGRREGIYVCIVDMYKYIHTRREGKRWREGEQTKVFLTYKPQHIHT